MGVFAIAAAVRVNSIVESRQGGLGVISLTRDR